MRSSLLIGNGFNRTIDKQYSVRNILSSLIKFKENVNKNNQNAFSNLSSSNHSFSLNFESLVGESSNQSNSIKNAFEKIKDSLKGLNTANYPEKLHSKINEVKKNIDSIITTNYDFALEYNFSGLIVKEKKQIGFTRKPIGKNKGFKITDDNGFSFYHIHGELITYKNLCLGFLGYQKYNKSAFSHLKQKFWEPPKTNQHDKESVWKTLKASLPESLYSFLEQNIFILGFSLSDCEIILWNILLIRNELIRRNLYSKEHPVNKIVFCDLKEKDANDKESNFYKRLHIDYKMHLVNENDYINKYCECLDEIITCIKGGSK